MGKIPPPGNTFRNLGGRSDFRPVGENLATTLERTPDEDKNCDQKSKFAHAQSNSPVNHGDRSE